MVVARSTRSYGIRKMRGSFRYKVTVPNDLFEPAGIEQGTRVGVKSLCEDGCLVLCYTTDLDDTLLTVSASKHSSGELTIPSAFGAAGQLDDYEIQWELRENGEDYELLGFTTLQLPNYNQQDLGFIDDRNLTHVEQNLQDVKQEHYQLYFDMGSVEKLGWSSGDDVAIELCEIEGRVSIQFNPDTSNANEKSIKTLQDTGEGQQDLIIYVPNDIVKVLRFDDNFSLLTDSDKLIIGE